MSRDFFKPVFSTAGIDNSMLSDSGLMYASKINLDAPKIDTPALDGVGSFLSDNLGGIGTLASVIGGLMANRDRNNFSEKVYRAETARADREEKRATKFRSDFGKGWS